MDAYAQPEAFHGSGRAADFRLSESCQIPRRLQIREPSVRETQHGLADPEATRHTGHCRNYPRRRAATGMFWLAAHYRDGFFVKIRNVPDGNNAPFP